MIISGLLTLVVGIMMTGLFVASGDNSQEAHALIFLAFIFGIANGLLQFVGGALGMRAAKRPEKASDAVVFGFVALVSGVCSVVLAFNVQNVCACVLPLLYFIFALQVRQSA